jgi:hypothetical protein
LLLTKASWALCPAAEGNSTSNFCSYFFFFICIFCLSFCLLLLLLLATATARLGLACCLLLVACCLLLAAFCPMRNLCFYFSFAFGYSSRPNRPGAGSSKQGFMPCSSSLQYKASQQKAKGNARAKEARVAVAKSKGCTEKGVRPFCLCTLAVQQSKAKEGISCVFCLCVFCLSFCLFTLAVQ